MSLARNLLDHAEQLATLDRRRPRQVNLRRSVSASYYALFHLLTTEAAALYAAGVESSSRIGRTHNHGEMRKVSSLVANGKLPKAIQPPGGYTPSPDLKKVAKFFVDLQQLRHEADSEVTRQFQRWEALDLARQTREAFAAWERERKTDEARLYLACFLLWKRWDEYPR